MTSIVDPKAYWDLLETVWWIRSRDEEWVADMQVKSEEDKAALALFGLKPEAKLLPRLSLPEAEFNAAMQMVSACIAEPTLLDQTLDDLFKKVSSGQVRMTAIRFGRSSDGQIPVPLAELNGLMFRIATGNRVRAGLWSRSHDLLVWSSPQFLRAGAIPAYPARKALASPADPGQLGSATSRHGVAHFRRRASGLYRDEGRDGFRRSAL